MPSAVPGSIESELAHSRVDEGESESEGEEEQELKLEQEDEPVNQYDNPSDTLGPTMTDASPPSSSAAIVSVPSVLSNPFSTRRPPPRPIQSSTAIEANQRFPRPNTFPSESWPTPPIEALETPNKRAVLEQELATDPTGSPTTFQRLVLSTTIRSYTGGIKDGLAHGHGRAEFKAGQIYEGEFEAGLMHGEGCYTWPDGSSYTGRMTYHSATGVGLIVWPDGSTYQGDVVDGYRHGEGTFIDPSVPCLYEGQWKHGLRHGAGKLTYDDAGASFYEGQWFEGARHGYGLLRYKSGNLYEGEWIWDRKVGKGTMHWYTLNQRYTGSWLNDLPHGAGEYTWLDLPVSGLRQLDSVRTVISHPPPSAMNPNGPKVPPVTHFQHHNRYVGQFVQGAREDMVHSIIRPVPSMPAPGHVIVSTVRVHSLS